LAAVEPKLDEVAEQAAWAAVEVHGILNRKAVRQLRVQLPPGGRGRHERPPWRC